MNPRILHRTLIGMLDCCPTVRPIRCSKRTAIKSTARPVIHGVSRGSFRLSRWSLHNLRTSIPIQAPD